MDIKIDIGAFDVIRTSDEVEEALLAIAEAMAEKANNMHEADGYTAKSSKGRKRARGHVFITDVHTARSNAKHNTLIRVLGGES